MNKIQNIDLEKDISSQVKELLINQFEQSSYVHLDNFVSSLIYINLNNNKELKDMKEKSYTLIDKLDISVKDKIIYAFKKSSEVDLKIFLLKSIKKIPTNKAQNTKLNFLENMKLKFIKSYSLKISRILSDIGLKNEKINKLLDKINNISF